MNHLAPCDKNLSDKQRDEPREIKNAEARKNKVGMNDPYSQKTRVIGFTGGKTSEPAGYMLSGAVIPASIVSYHGGDG